MPKDPEHPSKRQRVPISCSVCRKRKIKCDRKKPFCSSCLRSGVEHLCQYEKPVWVHAQTTTGGGARGATAAENSAAQAAAQAVSRENGILDRAGDPFYPESASIPHVP